MNKSIHIKISGIAGAGRSELLILIGGHLQSLGHRVVAIDDTDHPIVEPLMSLEALLDKQPRNVLITTRELRGKKLPKHFAGEHTLPKATVRRIARRLMGAEQ